MDLRDSPEMKQIGALLDFVTAVGVSASGGRPAKKAISPLVPDSLRRQTIHQMCKAASERSFTIIVPGTHAPRPQPRTRRKRSGSRTIEHQRLFRVLARMGKPFLADSKTMRSRMLSDLLIEFEDSPEVPLLLELDVCQTASAEETVNARLENRIRDVQIRGNTYRWNRYKAKRGWDSRIGMATGPRAGSLRASTARMRLAFGRR
jgi:hypothetical protein